MCGAKEEMESGSEEGMGGGRRPREWASGRIKELLLAET